MLQGEKPYDHRRIGGLENLSATRQVLMSDHRRIGGLEKAWFIDGVNGSDHRRIGGLEILS